MGAGAELFNQVINQQGSPALFSATLANRPAFGYTGRIFISTDTREIYRDTGTSWELIGSGAGSVNIYNSDGTVTGLRTVNLNSNALRFDDTGNRGAQVYVRNLTPTGTLTEAQFYAETSGGVSIFGRTGPLYTSYKIISANNGYLYSSTGELAILADNSTGQIKFSSGGSSISQMTLNNLGRFLLNTTIDNGFLANIFGDTSVQGILRIYGGTTSPQRNIIITSGNSSPMTFTSAGRANIFIGEQSTIRQIGNEDSILIGRQAATQLSSGGGNTMLGAYSAGLINTGGFNIFLGYTSGNPFSAGQHNNIPDISDRLVIGTKNGTPIFSNISTRQVIINGSNTNIPNINNSIQFGIESTTRGFLQPVMTELQRNAITSPATGLSVFNNNSNRPNFYDGTAWRELTNIYLNDGTLISDRTITGNGFLLLHNNVQSPNNSIPTFVARYNQTTNLTVSQSLTGGYYYTALPAVNNWNFAGSATLGIATVPCAGYSQNLFNFQSAGSTVNVTQSTLRSVAAHTVFNQFGGNNNGIITHLTGLQILGLYNTNNGSITPTVNNAYGIIINNLSDYSHTFTISNRWGIYQDGTLDNNYFAGKLLIGTNTITGRQVHINGDIEFTTTLSPTSGGVSGQHLNIWVNGTQYKIELRNV